MSKEIFELIEVAESIIMKKEIKTKHAGGRPKEYTEEFIPKVEEYIKQCGVSIDPISGKVMRVKLPSIEGCCLYLGIVKDTIYNWIKEYKEFSDVIDKLRQVQAEFLIDYGLSGHFNSTISKVILTKHGYREGIDQTTNDKDLPTPIL